MAAPPRQQQQQQHHLGFRQKVATASETAICTTTSNQVGRRTLRQLLLPTAVATVNSNSNNTDDAAAYSVPIFQRRYCWTIPQWDTLWMDFTKRNTIRHSFGRLTCTNVRPISSTVSSSSKQQQEKNPSSVDGRAYTDHSTTAHPRSIIIDGQQRFTTVTLILAAIRDALLLSLNTATATTTKTKINNNDNDDPFLEMINRMLFLDVPAMEKWITSSSSKSNNTHDDKTISGLEEEGLVLEFCRLIPTYCDRNSYFAAILPPTSVQVQAFMAETYNPQWHRPVVAKHYFAQNIEALIVSKQSTTSRRQLLEQLTNSLLDGVDILYFPIDVSRGYDDGTEDTQVIYERLAIRDATWCKPRRATEYQTMDGTDMIRNLLLGSFETSESKTNFYKSYWLPFERSLYHDHDDRDSNTDNTTTEEHSMKAIMEAFLTNEKSKLDNNQQHQLFVSSRSFTTPSSMVGIGGKIYKDFESWMIFDYQQLWQKQKQKQQQQTASMEIEATGQHQQQQWSVGPSSLWTQSSSRSSSSSSSAEDHTRDVGRRLLEFVQKKNCSSTK